MRLPFILLLLALLLAGRAAQAQGSLAPTTQPASPALTASLPVAGPVPVDTAAALGRYFAWRRHNGHVSVGIGAGLLGLSSIALVVASQSKGEASLGPGALAVLSIITGVPLLVRGFVLTTAHSKAREQRVLQEWRQHRLSRRWARRALISDYIQPEVPR